MTIDGGRSDSTAPDHNPNRSKTFATIASIIVAVIGLLSSPAWGPPICRAIKVCAADDDLVNSSTGLNNAEATTTPSVSPAGSAPSTAGRPTPTSVTPSRVVRPSPSPSPSKRAKGIGYPAYAGDYCDAFGRAWQDGYKDRASDLSSLQIADTVFKIDPPAHYENAWGPSGVDAVCRILDTDHERAQLLEIHIKMPAGRSGAITEVKV